MDILSAADSFRKVFKAPHLTSELQHMTAVSAQQLAIWQLCD